MNSPIVLDPDYFLDPLRVKYIDDVFDDEP